MASKNTTAKSNGRDSSGRFSGERFEERRSELVSVAAELFAANGYHGTSMADLTKAADLQRGGIYHYVESKAQLLFLIHEQVMGPLADSMQKIEERDEPAPVALRELAHALIGNIVSNNAAVRVFLHEWRSVRNDPQWEKVRTARRNLERLVETVLERGVQDGSLDATDIRLTSLGFLGMVNYTYTWYTPEGSRSPAEIADKFADIFLRGVEAT